MALAAKRSLIREVEALLREPEEESLYRLGDGLVHAYAPPGTRCSAPYVKIGTELWEAIEYDIHKVLCNGKKPKEWTGQVLDGDVKDLAVAIVALVMANFEATLAIAVPAAALVVRKGLAKLCRHKPNRPKRSAKAIMASMKRSWRKHGR